MVCSRCVMAVQQVLDELGYQQATVSLGEINLPSTTLPDKTELQKKLSNQGFGLLEDPASKKINQVKAIVAEVYSGDFDFPEKFRFASLVNTRLDKGYETARDIFISIEHKTLEQYIIEFRINKVKEFLVYSGLTLADISFKLNFSSVAHLSTQFKQQTGLTPSFFRSIKDQKAAIISPTD